MYIVPFLYVVPIIRFNHLRFMGIALNLQKDYCYGDLYDYSK